MLQARDEESGRDKARSTLNLVNFKPSHQSSEKERRVDLLSGHLVQLLEQEQLDSSLVTTLLLAENELEGPVSCSLLRAFVNLEYFGTASLP